MQTKENCITQIEDLLGSNGSRQIAESMFNILDQNGYISADEGGYTLLSSQISDQTWLNMLVDATEQS